ncbi:tetratricopeptide repeat protein [Burkholderia gladioli]|uniref:tetratricopeptide repeat protein n=1 Tax=Burkholderia gladioli TaxID=28095 RepID=UPI0016400CCB|nr:tetratricopeptide repeat protein [Burkholderia gladioli]
MLKPAEPTKQSEFSVVPTPVEVVLVEDGNGPLTFRLPPLEDLWEMSKLKTQNFSLTDLTHDRKQGRAEWFLEEFSKLEQKEEKFGKSPRYLGRLANLALLADAPELEAEYLSRALEIAPRIEVKNDLGENLLRRNMLKEAESLFRDISEENNVHAILRVAFFRVKNNDIGAAEHAVLRALTTDPFHYGARLFNGSLCLVQGKLSEAVHNFRIAQEERPNSAVLQANLAVTYAMMKNNEKALSAAKHAVALDPLNQYAVSLLADLANAENCNEDAIPALRYLVTFEQKNAGIWGRFARALLSIGSIDEAISALHRQGSLSTTGEVFNNLGVAYHRKGRALRKRAYDAFKHAALSPDSEDERTKLVASRNLCSLLFEDKEYRDLAVLARVSIATDKKKFALTNRRLSDIYVYWILAEANSGFAKSAADIAYATLGEEKATPALTAWTAAWLISYHSLRDERDAALNLISRYSHLVSDLSQADFVQRNMLANNIAFAFAEQDKISDAERYLQFVSNQVHIDPYPTATLGLLHIKKGNIERAKNLYEEAIRLAKHNEDKAVIRQKLNLEIGRHHLESNRSLASRFLEKAITQKDGAAELSRQALRARRLLLSDNTSKSRH